MDSQTIRTELGKLQGEPDSEASWQALASAAEARGGDLADDEFLHLVSAARQRHAARGEWQAVDRLLSIASKTAEGLPEELEILRERARVLQAELFADESAAAVWQRILEILPDDADARAAVDEIASKRGRAAELAQRYLDEAQNATDDTYKSSMLMHAAEMDVRFGGEGAELGPAIERLEQAVRLDPGNERPGRLLELLQRRRGEWEEVARVLERIADRAEAAEQRVAASVRLARVYAQHLGDEERAARALEGVLRDVPDHQEAMGFLTEFYSSKERWADLVALYERELASKRVGDPELIGDMLQIAMLYYRKLDRPRSAEPWFARIAKSQPANEAMLSFYREYCTALGDDGRLMEVLQTAQRSLKDGSKDKALLAAELARLAEGQENAQKAIEQYKAVLRSDPDNVEAREKLKGFYKQTQSYNALVELLRQQLERLPVEKYEARLAVLREVATIYREYIRSDTALLSVLNQIVQLDEKLDERDVGEMREIVALYDKLGRARDMITHQLKLAEITPDVEEKVTLYRAAGRRWLEQFSNAQNAADAYAKLLELVPSDREARERLEELYRKRRAWPSLYDLFQVELRDAQGPARSALLIEMAQLAAERLNRADDATRLYKEVLSADPTRLDVLDQLEKHAERVKDWPALAGALEQRVGALHDDAQKLIALQKLGAVYGDHLADPKAAANAWRRVLELSPGQQRALRVLRDACLASGDFEGLEQLYAGQNDWEGLVEVLSTAADRSKDNAVRIDLSYRAALVYEQRLGQPDRAFRSYERVLSADPRDLRAARALIPLYEKDEKWGRLPPLYELLVERAETPDEKLTYLSRLSDVATKHLSDRRAAANYARRAYEIAPDSAEALALLEQASRAASSWETFVQAIEERLKRMPDTEAAVPAEPSSPQTSGGKKKKRRKTGGGEESQVGSRPESPASSQRRMLELKLARVYSDELGRTDDAIAVYKGLLSRKSSDTEAASSLEVLLKRLDRRDELRWLLDLRVDNADSDAERIAILNEWALLEEEAFESADRAAALYKRVLEIDATDATALATLPDLLLSTGDVAGAAAVIEQRRDVQSGTQRADSQLALAELYLGQLNRPEDALSSAVDALTLDTHAPRAVEILERLVERPETRARAAEVLSERYAGVGDARREANSLRTLLEATRDPAERQLLEFRLAHVYEHKLGSYGAALDVILGAVREAPQEMPLWERADALATQAGRPTDLAEAYREVLRGKVPSDVEAELCERAARLHEDKLGDPIGATPYLERVLSLKPNNEPAFRRLKDILTGAERWSELEALYDRAAAATDDPLRKVEMLAEVALVCEEIVEDAQKAMRYYERILEIDQYHESSTRALDRLYGRFGKDKELSLLLERRLETAVGDEALDLKLRLARLQLDLHQPEKAIQHVEDVLRERINDHDARQLAERMLAIGELRVRAARCLEAVYEERDEVRDLVRVLEVRLESEAEAGGDDRRELIRRVAVLRNERLHDDEGAFAAFSRLVPLEPSDSEARARLLEIGKRLSADERVAKVLLAAADATEAVGLSGEILTTVAVLFEERLSDLKRAEQIYRRVLELDPNEPSLVLPAARSLERIYKSQNEPQKLADILRVQVRMEGDGGVRRDLLGRLGELCQNVLHDNNGAIVAFRARLDENPDDEPALAALDTLYEATGKHSELVDVLRRRRELSDDAALRRTLLTRSAEILWRRIGALPEAIGEYRSLVDEFGPTASSLSALEELFRLSERWDDLSDTYERHLDIAEADAERLDIFSRLGDLKRERQNDIQQALEVYRRALAVDPKYQPIRAALDTLLESPDPATRREVAQILRPLYEADGDGARMLAVLEIEIGTAEDPLDQLAGLEAALRVADKQLGDPNRAFGYAERAVRVAIGHSEITEWFAEAERLAQATSRQADYVKLLCDAVGSIFDGEVQLAVTLKIADMARSELKDRELSRDYYKRALDLRADEPHALAALETLYEESGDATNLLDILERRSEGATNDDERKRLLYRRASLLADVLDDKNRAIETYESVLDMALEDQAISALEKLYTSAERWGDLIALYERQIQASRGNASDLRVRIAGVAARHTGDPERAFDELEQALKADRQHEGAISEIERLLKQASDAGHRARAAELLEPVYLARADYDRVMAAMQARLEVVSDPDDRRELLTRLAKLYEEQKEDYAQALETTARLLHEDIDDAHTVDELERLSRVAGAERRLAEIYAEELGQTTTEGPAVVRLARRAGEIFDLLGEPARALSFYRRALAFEPENRSLFSATDAILVRQGLFEDRIKLHRDALDHYFEPSERLALLHTIAAVERRELKRPDDAIATYRSALEIDEREASTLDALTELFIERERWDDLSELYLSRAEQAERPERGIRYRLDLARLSRKLERGDRALDQLEEIVRLEPAHADAIAELEALRADDRLKERVVEILRPLYEAADDWRRLVKLNEDRFALGDDVEKVSVLRETARLWEQRGGDKKRARRALETAVRIDPDDADVRSEYERLIEETGAHAELSKAYEAILEERPDLNSKADFYRVLARVHDQKLDDPRRALWAYDRLREADPNDVTSLDSLERLAILLSDWPTLVRVLEAKSEVFLDDEERAGFLRRIGEAKRDMLDDREGAIEAYERAFELDPTSAFTADCLIELYEAKGKADRLVELYQRRVELTSEDDADLKYTLLVAAAAAFEDKLKDRSSAIDMLVRALETKPGDKDALTGLDRLYRAESLWSELLENLRTRVTFAETAEARVALRKEMGAVLGDKLNSPEDALGAYREALDEIPSDAEAVSAVHTLGQDHEELRRQVAEILEPVLRKTERYEPLIDVLELRFSVESDPSDRSRTLWAIAEVYEGKLGKPREAEGALLRALSERPEAEDLHNEIVRLARTSTDFKRYADTLTERAQGTFEAELARDLYVRLGKVAEDELKDRERAVTAYERAIEQAGDAPDLLKALERLYASLGQQDKVADSLERLVVLVSSDAEQAEIYQRLAQIQSSHFKDDARALSSLRAALERVPGHAGAVESLERLTGDRDLFDEVSEILEEVYRTRGEAQKLAALWQKRVEFASDVEQRASMRRGLARVLEEDVKDVAAAQRVVEQGLIEVPADAELVDELERLAGITGDFTSAADSLRQAIDGQRERIVPDLACALARRLSVWHRDRRNDPAAAESALLYGLEFDPDNEELLIDLEELQRKPGRERDLVATLRRRATLESSPDTRAELYQTAKALADGLNDETLAEGLLRELLALDDTNLWALAELSRQRESARDFKEAFKLLIRRAELGVDGEESRKLRRRAAEIAKTELGDTEKATELYEALFEEEPTDRDAAAALRSLYEQAGSYRELGRLIERLIDVSDDTRARSDLRIELAKLSEERFGSVDTAIELVRAVLDDEPGRPDAVVALSELFERAKRDEDLADLLSSQIDAAKARGDVDAELRFQVRLGEVYESRLGDRARAIETYRAVLDRDASHRGALECLARLYQSEARLADAAEVLDKLLEMSSGKEAVELAIRLAETHDKLGAPADATAALERGLEHDQQQPELRTRLRKAYEAQENWEKLGTLLTQDADFAKTDEERVGLLRRAAKLHAERRDDHEKAAELLNQATQIKPDDRELLLELCDEYNASGRGKAAAEVLEKIVVSYGNKRSKDLAEIHRRLAGAYLADGNGARALEELDKAFRIEPGNVNVLSLLGETALELGDLKKAQQMYRALLLQKLDEGGPVQKGMVFVRLGDIHDKLGEKPKAVQMYERALQTDPRLAEAKTKLAQLKSG